MKPLQQSTLLLDQFVLSDSFIYGKAYFPIRVKIYQVLRDMMDLSFCLTNCIAMNRSNISLLPSSNILITLHGMVLRTAFVTKNLFFVISDPDYDDYDYDYLVSSIIWLVHNPSDISYSFSNDLLELTRSTKLTKFRQPSKKVSSSKYKIRWTIHIP